MSSSFDTVFNSRHIKRIIRREIGHRFFRQQKTLVINHIISVKKVIQFLICLINMSMPFLVPWLKKGGRTWWMSCKLKKEKKEQVFCSTFIPTSVSFNENNPTTSKCNVRIFRYNTRYKKKNLAYVDLNFSSQLMT